MNPVQEYCECPRPMVSKSASCDFCGFEPRPDVEIRPTPEGYVFVPLSSKGLETLLYTSVQDHDVNKRTGWLGASGIMNAERAKELKERLRVIGCTVAGGL